MGSSQRNRPAANTGRTQNGNVRDVKIERIGGVTIYKRGVTYYLYYRQNRRTERHRIDGNLAVARATAAKILGAIGENRPSPLGFDRTTPQSMTVGYLDYVESVQKLAWRTHDRYRAALQRFLDFCEVSHIPAIDAVDEAMVEDFVRWLRGRTRTRNGAIKGRKDTYKVGGVKFILSTCRTAFNWAKRRRMLPPYAENAFTRFPIDQLRDSSGDDEGTRVFTREQEAAFFAACNEWQRGIFVTLAALGIRVGELTNLLVENVDLGKGVIQICSKPELFWKVKTGRRRQLPLTGELKTLFAKLIGERKAGFVFLNESHFAGTSKLRTTFASDAKFRERLQTLVQAHSEETVGSTEKDRRRLVTRFCRAMGQIPVKRIQSEFSKLTASVGCPEFTRPHDLRHLFTSRAQENGANPLLIQELLGHATLDMTRRYTHLDMEAKREAVEKLSRS